LVDSRVFLAIKSDLKPEQLIKLAPSVTRIASSGQIEKVINSAIAGLRIARPLKVPAGIQMRLGYEYFQLDTTGPFWQGIVKSRSLAVFVPSDISEPAMELVILLKAPV
jgi:type VI secretion system protein ImpJ